ncbi:hypothetical protein [Sphingobacterium sp.]|uniref:hypothetical protein n=1 Tax=Sphingobacterium sp. TaxID=341027 RepID=UPI0028B10E8F|nr:hypothetical protein [Sphingobacterium sp.]
MKKLMLLGISSILLWSCHQNSDHSHNHDAESHAAHQHDHVEGALELNNGKKWTMNEEMKPFVLKGVDLIQIYVQEKQTDNLRLAKELKEQNDQLIKSCTMDGKGHDELHKWLHPHMELVKELEAERNPEKVNVIIAKLHDSYMEFSKFFN